MRKLPKIEKTIVQTTFGRLKALHDDHKICRNMWIDTLSESDVNDFRKLGLERDDWIING